MTGTDLFFHHDFVDFLPAREFAVDKMLANPVIRRAAAGDRDAALLIMRGFAPFVRNFGRAIDRRGLNTVLLRRHFEERTVRQKIVGIANELREMAREEGDHWLLWSGGARELGENVEDVDGTTKTVRYLIDVTDTAPWPLYPMFLAGTELIAVAVSEILSSSDVFNGLFPQTQWWAWVDPHVGHVDGGLHYRIDIDLARATGLQKEMVEPLLRMWVLVYDGALHELLNSH